MLAVLAIGLSLLAVLAVWLKKRHRRKLEEQRAEASGFPITRDPNNRLSKTTSRDRLGQDMWGPHQHMAHTRGWEYGNEKESDRDAVGALGGHSRKKNRKGNAEKEKEREANGRKLQRRESDRGSRRSDSQMSERDSGLRRPRSERRTDKKKYWDEKEIEANPDRNRGADIERPSTAPLTRRDRDVDAITRSREV